MPTALIEAIKRSKPKRRTSCAACDRPLGQAVIDLPNLPLTEIFIDSKPKEYVGLTQQGFHVCEHCNHGQLSHLVDPAILYGFSYSYKTTKSSASMKGNDDFRDFITKIIGKTHFSNIVDIGCNDLYLLGLLKEYANKRIGIDPQLAVNGPSKDSIDPSITLVADFFENVNLKEVLSSGPSLYVSSHNLEHIENPQAMIKTLFANASSDDLFILQFPGLETLVDDLRFDLIFHHHCHYFSLQSFETMVSQLGGEIISHRVNRPFWGSLMVAFKYTGKGAVTCQNNYAPFVTPKNVAQRFEQFKQKMSLTQQLLNNCREPLYGYGAPLSLPALAYHLDSDFSNLKGIVDDDPRKDGKYYLNLPVPIISLDKVQSSLNETNFFVTGLNHARSIIPKLLNMSVKRIVLPATVF